MYKYLFKTAALASILVISLAACKKDDKLITAQFSAAPKLTTNSTNAGILLFINQADTIVKYSWNPYTFTLSGNAKADSPVTYTLQFALAGTNFTTPAVYEIVATSAASSSLALTVGQLNEALIFLKAPVGQIANLEVRLKTFVAYNEPILYTNTTTISATPYDGCVAPNSDVWSLIGPAGTDWSTDIPLKWNCVSNAYVLTMALKADQFKFRQNGSWTTNLGGVSGSLAIGAPFALNAGGANLVITTAGMYTIKLVPNGVGAAATTGTVTVTP